MGRTGSTRPVDRSLPLRCGVLSSGNLCARHALRYAGHSADGRCESRCARRVRRGAHLHDRGRVCGGVRHEGPEDRKIAVMPDGSFASTSFCDGAVDACGTAGESHSPKIRLRAAAKPVRRLAELLLGQRCGFCHELLAQRVARRYPVDRGAYVACGVFEPLAVRSFGHPPDFALGGVVEVVGITFVTPPGWDSAMTPESQTLCSVLGLPKKVTSNFPSLWASVYRHVCRTVEIGDHVYDTFYIGEYHRIVQLTVVLQCCGQRLRLRVTPSRPLRYFSRTSAGELHSASAIEACQPRKGSL